MTFTELCHQTFNGLKNMEPGAAIELRKTQMYRDYGQEFIVDVCKQFIDADNRDYELTDDYKYIKRLSFKF